jgi:hypothetical protein
VVGLTTGRRRPCAGGRHSPSTKSCRSGTIAGEAIGVDGNWTLESGELEMARLWEIATCEVSRHLGFGWWDRHAAGLRPCAPALSCPGGKRPPVGCGGFVGTSVSYVYVKLQGHVWSVDCACIELIDISMFG